MDVMRYEADSNKCCSSINQLPHSMKSQTNLIRIPKRIVALIFLTISLTNWACSTSTTASSAASSPEAWTGTFTGIGHDAVYGGGKFVEQGTIDLTFPSSLTAALQLPYNPDTKISSGTGLYTDVESVDEQETVATLYPHTATNVPVVVTYASIVNLPPATPEIFFGSTAGQWLIQGKVIGNGAGSDYSRPCTGVVLVADTVSSTMIWGKWRADASSENTAQGWFTLKKK